MVSINTLDAKHKNRIEITLIIQNSLKLVLKSHYIYNNFDFMAKKHLK